jgi:glycine/D-amino acid oxidase-like deaminating enzyme
MQGNSEMSESVPADLVSQTWSRRFQPAESIPGFHIATGFSGHGFGIGPGAGKAIAGMLTGTDTGIDLSAFRLSRFFDGTKM